jgi:non-specific serine/threonine protein kinase
LIDWSYDLLEPQESMVLMRLSVFAGGFDLRAAEAVVGGEGADPLSTVDHISSLVDKSLIHVDGAGPVRYRLLETIRDYAAAKLSEVAPNAPDDARRAHRDYFLSLAQEAAPQVSGPDQVQWLDRLEAELDNFRLALSYCLSDPDPSPGLRLSTALWNFWLFQDHVTEGATAICAQLDRPETLSEATLRGHALVVAGNLLASFTPELGESLARAQDGLTAGRASGDQRLVAQALHALAIASGRKGEFGSALNFANEGLAIEEVRQDTDLAARLHMARANIHFGLGEDPLPDFNEALRLFRDAGNNIASNLVLNNIAYNEIGIGQLDSARDHLDEALSVARELGHRIGILYASYNRGLVALLDGDVLTARRLFIESLRIAFQSGELSEVADALLGLAFTNSKDGNLQVAATLHGAAAAIEDQAGAVVTDPQSRLRGEDHEKLRKLLGDEAFAVAYKDGHDMPIESCITLATR